MTRVVKLFLLSCGYFSNASRYSSGAENLLLCFFLITSIAVFRITSYMVIPGSRDMCLPLGGIGVREMSVSALLTIIVTVSPSMRTTPVTGMLKATSFMMADTLLNRLKGSHNSIKGWDYYRYDKLPDSVNKKQRRALERMLIHYLAALIPSSSDVPCLNISKYRLVNERVDSR